MMKADEYVHFKNRSRKHMSQTLNSFRFWGATIGRIDGDIKDKWGEVRWYANLERPQSIYEVINLNHRYYGWDPTKSKVNAVLDTINNLSKFFSILLYVFILHRLFFYNVAYWVAIAKNPDCAADIVWAADYPRKILFGKKMAMIMHTRNERKHQK